MAAVVLTAAVGLSTSACVSAPSATRKTAEYAPKTGDMQLRHDAEPLTSRWPALDGLESAAWMSGTVGDDRAPGPSTYWIDAVVVLPAEAYDALRAKATATVDAPIVVPGVSEHVPNGVLHGGSEADAAFSTPEYPARIALDDATCTVVLSAVFGG